MVFGGKFWIAVFFLMDFGYNLRNSRVRPTQFIICLKEQLLNLGAYKGAGSGGTGTVAIRDGSGPWTRPRPVGPDPN